MRPRAVLSDPLAMARPGRPAREAQLVRAAATMTRGAEGGRALARQIAERVVDMAIEDLERVDSFDAALAELGRALAPSPIAELATDPAIDTAAEITRRRLARYAARSCRQLSDLDRDAETRDIAAEAAATLANRYARYLGRRNISRTAA